jgi:membrane protease YdiL (CAAX protease family)
MTSQTPFEHHGSPPTRPELPEGVDRPAAPAASEPLPTWPAWAPFAAMLLTLVIAIAGATAITVFAQLAGIDITAKHTPPGVQIGGTIVQDIALIVSAVVFARVTAGRASAFDFGLRPVRLGRAFAWMAGAWATFIVFSGIWAALVHAPNDDQLPKELGADDSTLNLVVVMVLVTVIAPVCEEFFFRGFCFTALRRWINAMPAAILTGLIFGGIHAGSSNTVYLVPLAFFGFVLCVLYQQTGSLLPCMALHALNNALALSVAQHFSALGTVALMLGAATVVVSLGLVASRSRRLNAAPAAA